MTILSLLLVLGAVQIWGSGAPLHRDAWFYSLLESLRKLSTLRDELVLFAALIIPLAGLGIALALAAKVLPVLGVLTINVLVLLYSLGRGDFSRAVNQYIDAAERQDSTQASLLVDELAFEPQPSNTATWSELHLEALQAVVYRGFERLFAVFFWFLVLGAPGALLYRLSVLYRENLEEGAHDQALVNKWLWAMEWPAVRLLGLSWALAGNFVSCYEQWRECLFCALRGSANVLEHYVQGALNLRPEDLLEKDEACHSRASAEQIRAVQSLLSRTLWLWLCVIAIVSLLL